MPESKNDFKLIYDPKNMVLVKNRPDAEKALMDCPAAFTFFRRNSMSTVSVRKEGTKGDIRILLGGLGMSQEILPPQAEFRAFSQAKDLGFYRVDALKNLVECQPDDGADNTGPVDLNISEYYNGKLRKATNGAAEFNCTITITRDAWETMESLGSNGGIDQIIGILQQDPILITQKSKQMGVRCIKPEPYGWIFSTSFSNRLIAGDAITVNPAALTFSKVSNVK